MILSKMLGIAPEDPRRKKQKLMSFLRFPPVRCALGRGDGERWASQNLEQARCLLLSA